MNDQAPQIALPSGYELHWYRIDRVLGQGAFGITYLAHDVNLDREVAIKEYLPGQFAVRKNDLNVIPFSDKQKEDFEWGLKRFISEARTLTKFEHPNLVRVFNVFEMNNTAYMVMNYELGKSLQQILKSRKTLREDEIAKILGPLMNGLELMHEKGFVHRDIKPGNIFIRGDGSPVLLDFGSARQTRFTKGRDEGSDGSAETTTTLTTLVSPGYAPIEQYGSSSDRQGPWTDIYGLGATLYRAVTGLTPIAAMDRGEAIVHDTPDPYLSITEAYKDRYSENFLAAIDHAMAFKAKDRPQNIADWRKEFGISEIGPVATAEEDIPTEVADGHTMKLELPEEETIKVSGDETIKTLPVEEKTVAVLPEIEEEPTTSPGMRNLFIAGLATILVLIGTLVHLSRNNEEPAQGIAIPEEQTGTSVPEQETMPVAEETTLQEQQQKIEEEPGQQQALEQRPGGEESGQQQALEQQPGGEESGQQQALEQQRIEEERQRQQALQQQRIAEEHKQKQIRELLKEAGKDVEALRLTRPKDDNAFDKYLAVIKLDENNQEAGAGIRSISDKYVAMAYGAIAKNKLTVAESYLKRASAITPKSKKIATAKKALQTKRAELKAARIPEETTPAPDQAVTAEEKEEEEETQSFWDKVKKWHEENMKQSRKIDKSKTIDERVRKTIGGP